MPRRANSLAWAAIATCLIQALSLQAIADDAVSRPNIVLILADDLGYGDLGCYGARGYATVHLDRLAAQGARFTSFYVPQAVCSSSRVGLLTGCYPNRLQIVGALGPKADHGIAAAETTLGELLHAAGYATAIFGKWHLGHHRQFLPTHHGFDEYFGLPYSNDMWPHHPTARQDYPELPLIEGDRVVRLNPDQSQLTTWYTERAVEFIERNRSRPFFLYLPHTMPHVPLHVSAQRRGGAQRGLFGDVIAELDWSVGQIMAALDKHGLAENTLLVFTSDNGPWLSYGPHAGSAGRLREGKGTAFEGGVRVPAIARWPGKITAGRTIAEPAMSIDLLPTCARLAGAKLPQRPIDGRDIWPLVAGEPGAQSPHEAYLFYWLTELHAVRAGRWKLHLPHSYPHVVKPGAEGNPGRIEERKISQQLFDLQADAGESRDVAAEHPEVVSKLLATAERARDDLGDSLTGRKGRGVRSADRLAQSKPKRLSEDRRGLSPFPAVRGASGARPPALGGTRATTQP